jgi:hypothetical protein
MAMSERLPWYLVPRSMGSWQMRLMALVAPLLACGAGFLLGYLFVRFPGRGDYATMPAPSWLIWTGVACTVVGVAAFAVARLTSPPYDSDPDAPSVRPKRVREVTLLHVVCALIFIGALITCSIAAASSDYRWRPMWVALMILAVGVPISLLASRERS